MPNSNTTNNNNVNGEAGDNGNPRKVEYIEPIETPFLKKIEPTASFAMDIKTDFEGPPLMKTHYTLHFRPGSNWAGKEYGFEWLRVGDSGQWNDSQAEDHLVKRIGKYYYSHSKNDSFEAEDGSTGGTTGRRFALYYWQIRKIWEDVDCLNGGIMTPVPMESSNKTTESQSYEVYTYRSKVRI